MWVWNKAGKLKKFKCYDDITIWEFHAGENTQKERCRESFASAISVTMSLWMDQRSRGGNMYILMITLAQSNNVLTDTSITKFCLQRSNVVESNTITL